MAVMVVVHTMAHTCIALHPRYHWGRGHPYVCSPPPWRGDEQLGYRPPGPWGLWTQTPRTARCHVLGIWGI